MEAIQTKAHNFKGKQAQFNHQTYNNTADKAKDNAIKANDSCKSTSTTDNELNLEKICFDLKIFHAILYE